MALLAEEARNEWISVEDRLPTVSIHYLVTGIFPVGYMVAEWDGNLGQWMMYDPIRIELGDVTHWQPLPSPPELE